MERKGIFFTSDWHCFHENCLTFDNRPFKDLDHMHEVLINNYNSTVKDGICYFLGDMGLCSSENLGKIVSRLGGTKVLILGNHDKGTEAMYKIGFDDVLYGATMLIANKKVTLSHCPLLGVYREKCENMKGSQIGENWHGESRDSHDIFTTTDEGQFHLHGHIHSPNSGKSEKILKKQFDVGVVSNGFKPVNISAIESWIAKNSNRAHNFRDLTGQIFGRLTVVDWTGNAHGNSNWRCICSCGNETIVLSGALRSGATKSCGCLMKETHRLGKGESGFNRLFKEYVRGAEDRGLEFKLTENEVKEITKQNCHYCNVCPSNSKVCAIKGRSTEDGIKHSEYIYNGIDRKDNSIGYVIDNCVPCCTVCNRAKSNLPYEEFLEYINRIRNNSIELGS